MKILITGANGFLGFYVVKQLINDGHVVIATGKGKCRLPFNVCTTFFYEEMDFTDPFQVHDVFTAYHPECVVHAGAMTRPDDCELNQWDAYVTNVEGTVTMLLNAEEFKCSFIFISTDFVFDGSKGMYEENDIRSPVNFYGKTKMEAEDAVMAYEYNWVIVRTVLVYGPPATGRSNLLTVVAEKLSAGEQYRVFDDQVRTPTFVKDLAAGISMIISQKATGIFHLSGKDVLTPYGMALATAELLGLDVSLLEKITRADMQQPATRPMKTGFDISKAEKELKFQPVAFRDGLKGTFR